MYCHSREYLGDFSCYCPLNLNFQMLTLTPLTTEHRAFIYELKSDISLVAGRPRGHIWYLESCESELKLVCVHLRSSLSLSSWFLGPIKLPAARGPSSHVLSPPSPKPVNSQHTPPTAPAKKEENNNITNNNTQSSRYDSCTGSWPRLVCYTAVFRVVTQRSSPGEERCVTTLKTAV